MSQQERDRDVIEMVLREMEYAGETETDERKSVTLHGWVRTLESALQLNANEKSASLSVKDEPALDLEPIKENLEKRYAHITPMITAQKIARQDAYALLAECERLRSATTVSSAARCEACGGPHPFDTSVPSVQWNAVVRPRELPDKICTTCIVKAFVEAGESFTAVLHGANFNGEAVEFRVGSRAAIDADLVCQELTALRIIVTEIADELERSSHGPNGWAIRLRKALATQFEYQRLSEAQRLRATPATPPPQAIRNAYDEGFCDATMSGLSIAQAWEESDTYAALKSPATPQQEGETKK